MGESNELNFGGYINTLPILFMCVGIYFLLKVIKPDWFGDND